MQAIALLAAWVCAGAANPPSGQASNEGVSVAAVILDPAAVKQTTGSDFTPTFTVIERDAYPEGRKICRRSAR